MEQGKLIIFSAPSGSGKTTIVKHLLEQGYKLEFSISACNRQPRGKEQHGKDYYFLDTDDFKARIEKGEFLEWEEVYEGRFYGTLRSEMDRIWHKGNHVLFDIDVKGGVNVKQQFGDQALSLFVQAPSIEELKRRLESRGTDSARDIEMRLEKAAEELGYANQFDYIIVNDDLEKAKTEAEHILNKFLKK